MNFVFESSIIRDLWLKAAGARPATEFCFHRCLSTQRAPSTLPSPDSADRKLVAPGGTTQRRKESRYQQRQEAQAHAEQLPNWRAPAAERQEPAEQPKTGRDRSGKPTGYQP